MKNILIWLMAMLCLASCGSKHTGPAKPKLSQEQSAFMAQWCDKHGMGCVAVLNLFKASCIRKQSLQSLDEFLRVQKLTVDFSNARKKIASHEELLADTAAHAMIGWIDHRLVDRCRKEDPGFWTCFNKVHDVHGFAYFSMPLFSNDGKWCLLSTNYIAEEKGRSAGRDILYHFEENSWEEAAILSYWGKQPE